ncbi:MAG: helicase-related protein [Hyphomicrobiaceae bacterium]
MSLQSRIRNVTAVLGPTNTGKTHLAIERMLGHSSGMIGLPLRLLAREVYDKIAARVGAANVALVTGEEKIKPDNPKYWVATVEAMPREVETEFLAIDEVQLAADPERGHVFTDRILNARGRAETLLLGAGTMREAISDLIPGANFISRPRLSKITYSGQKKITRLPKRTAVVAFSAAEVYEIAELIRRQIGGAAVVLGALSPRTRNAQVELYQSGQVDHLVATDAIGMGLNLDVDHVAFASSRKFDGHNYRNLTPSEIGQIAGRAGRHMNDGTFGVTGSCEPFDSDLIERLETHNFDPVRTLQWRNANLDFQSLENLRESLRALPREARLQRARMADDVLALETLSGSGDIVEKATSRAAVELLWDACQVPDYRKISSQNHAELVATLYGYLVGDTRKIPEDWFAKQVELADRTDGDIDTLATRLSHIRTWTFVANRSDWLADPAHWQGRTRAIEDSLSDALHEQLTQRFVDQKTSALMRGLRDKDELSAEIAADGAVNVENHFVGRLKGFRFQPDTQADLQGVHGKASRGATAQVLANEFAMRARRVVAAKTDAFKLTRSARILWRDEEIARLEAGEDPLKPTVVVLADEHLTGPDKERIQQRLDAWIGEIIAERLKSLVELKNAEDITGLARGIAFRLVESLGALKRESIAEEMRQLDQPSRAQLRKYSVRFGAFNIFLPLLLKPAAADLTLTLWSLKYGQQAGLDPENLPEPPRPGLTSATTVASTPEAFYRAAGYHVCGPRAIRLDILERLADQIRPLLAWRASETGSIPPKGSTGEGSFYPTPDMMSVLGCSSEELGNVLRSLGFRSEMRPAPAKPAPKTPVAPAAASAEESPGEAVATIDAAAPEAAAVVEPAVVSEAPAETTAEATVPAGDAVATDVPTAEVEAAPEVTATEPAAAGPEAEATPAPPEMIEVWRPKRREREHHHRGGRGHRDGQGQDQRQGQGRGRGRGGQRHDRGGNGATRPAAGSEGAADVAVAAPSGDTPAPEQRHERPQHHRRPDQRGPGNRDKRDRDQRPAHHQHGRGGPDRREGGGRRDDRRRDERRSEVRSASPQRKGPDPDSPFAALAALKSQLEGKGKDRN